MQTLAKMPVYQRMTLPAVVQAPSYNFDCQRICCSTGAWNARSTGSSCGHVLWSSFSSQLRVTPRAAASPAPEITSAPSGTVFATQDGVEALNSANGDFADFVDVWRGHMLNVVKLGEKAAHLGSLKSVEFVASLFAQVGSIDQKKNPASFGVFDQPIGDDAGRVGFSGPGRHVDEGSRAIVGEGVFESFDQAWSRRRRATMRATDARSAALALQPGVTNAL